MKKFRSLLALMILPLSMTQAEVITADQVLEMRNAETGIKEYQYNVKDDNWSIDLSYGFSPNLMKAGDISSFRGQITFYNPDTEMSWMGYAAQSNVVISQATDLTGNYDSDIETLTITEMGIGLARRSALIKNFLSSPRVYDEVNFAALYSSADSDVFVNKMSGYGMVAGYAVFWRNSKATHWGLRADYHLHSLEDSTDETNEIEATASWVSLAATFGLIF
jgi:hypothetical protein